MMERGIGKMKLKQSMRCILLLILCGFLTQLVYARNLFQLPETLLDSLFDAKIPVSAISVYVRPIDESQPRIAWRADLPMNPASTMKLVTTWAGLNVLGADYRWRTSIYVDHLPVDGVLRGNVYIVGGGDPKLVPEELEKFMHGLRQVDVNKIDGDLILDKTLFIEGPDYDQTIDGQVDRAYNVPPDPLLYAFKSLNFKLIPSADGKVKVTVLPTLPQVSIQNHLIAHAYHHAGCSNWRAHVVRDPTGIVQAAFSGSLPVHCGEREYQIALLSHDEFFWGGFVSEWEKVGGQFLRLPSVGEGKVPSTAKLLVTHDGPRLSEVITDINKFSNNVMTRQLLLTIGSRLDGAPVYRAKAADSLKTWFAQQGIYMPELVLDNGAGLSRKARISAQSLAKILQRADGTVFVSSLPIVGVDGTMKNRLYDSPVRGNAWIKTGSLRDVRAIAGYVRDKNGRRYIVVSIINHEYAMAAGMTVFEGLLKWIYDGAL